MKGLEALKEIEKFIEKNLSKTKDNESFNLGFDIGIIEKELKDYEELKKVVEIINDKLGIQVWNKGCHFCFTIKDSTKHYGISKQKHDLLKGWLDNGTK